MAISMFFHAVGCPWPLLVLGVSHA